MNAVAIQESADRATSKKPQYLKILASIILPLLIFLGLIVCNSKWLLVVESDGVVLVSLYRDIFVDHYDLLHWNVSTLYLFPDAALFVAVANFFSDPGHMFTACSILFYFLFLAILVYLAFLLSGNFFRSYVTVLAAGLLLVSIALIPGYSNLIYRFVYFANHNGHIPFGFLLVAIAIRGVQKGVSATSAILFLIISVLSAVSDLLLVPQFLLPLLITFVIFMILRLVRVSTGLVYAGLILLAPIFSVLILNSLRAATPLFISNPFAGYTFTFDKLISSAIDFGQSLIIYIRFLPIFAAIAAIWLTVSIALLVKNRGVLLGFRKNVEQRSYQPIHGLLFLIVFSMLSMLGTMAGPIATFRWPGFWCVYYIQPLYIMPLFVIALAVCHFQKHMLLAQRIAAGAIVVIALFQVVPALASLSWEDLRFPYPGWVRCMDALAEEHDLQYGYGYYWSAKYASVASRAGIRVNQLDEDLTFHRWLNNSQWYSAAPAREGGKFPKYDFILVTPKTRNLVESRFGEPAASEYCSGVEVYVYNRESDVAFRNFLRAPALALVGKAPHAPTMPASLSVYKESGTAWDAEGRVMIPADGELTAEFDTPAAGEVLEIAASGNDEYRVAFYLSDTLLDEMTAPAMEQDSLQIRYLLLPESLRKKPFNRLVIRPVGGDGDYSVGHVFVYDDSDE